MKLQELMEGQEEMIKRLNITKRGPGPLSTGLDEEKGIWYGWSHRAVCGFKIGDKLFDERYIAPGKTESDMDKVKFTERGGKTIKTLSDAQKAAENFSDYVG